MGKYDWIEKGTEVVVVLDPRSTSSRAQITHSTVDKVNPRTFRVAGHSNPFSRDTGFEQKNDPWGEKRQVWAPDDPRIPDLQARNRVLDARDQVGNAYRAWQQDHTDRDKLFAIVAAAQKLDQEMERASLVAT